MALQPKELFGAANSQLPNLRAYPHEGGISVGQLEALAADADVAHLTPLFRTGTTWGVWQDADARVDGFLWAPDSPHEGLRAGETHIQILKRGVIDARDVPLPAGQTQATLDGLLAGQDLRDAGMTVQGLEGVA